MSDTPTVQQAIAAVMRDVGAVGKDRVNEAQRFKFRGIDDLMNALHGPLAKHGVVIAPEVLERLSEERTTQRGGAMNVVHLLVRYTLFGPAGDSITATVWGEAQDSADKATNKALSAAMKYALLQVFCVPTEDVEDADASHDDAAPSGQPVRSQASGGRAKTNAVGRQQRSESEPRAPKSAPPAGEQTSQTPQEGAAPSLDMFKAGCAALGVGPGKGAQILIELGWTFSNPGKASDDIKTWPEDKVTEAITTIEHYLMEQDAA